MRFRDISVKSDHYQTSYIHDENGNPILDPKDTADTFNNFFSNVLQKTRHNV